MQKILLLTLVLINIQLLAQENGKQDSLTKNYTRFKDTIDPYIYRDSLGNYYYTSVQIESEFSGGSEGWKSFIKNTLNADNLYPYIKKKEFKNKLFKQSAEVKFTVCTDGSLCDFEVVNEVNLAIKEEAIRIMKLSPKWKPAMQNGKLVKSKKIQRITFLLEQ